MRNRLFLATCFIAFYFVTSFGQCPEGNITIKTQAELNQLFSTYPNCHKIKKSISFINSAANPFTDLSLMLKIDTILGDLVLNVKNTPSIQGLSNIKYIGGDLSILSTDQLTTFPAFDSLQKVGLNIEIQNNPKLKSVRGFDKLTKVGTISISENELMDTIDAFNEVDTLLYTFSIHFMKKLEVVRACEKLKYCGNNISLNFQFSPNLKTLPAFDQLRFVKSDFTISEANSLSYQGLQSLDSLGSRLILAFPLATHFQLAPNARFINDLNLTNCPNLTRLEGFDRLISAGNIALNLPALTQLCPFPYLEKATLGLFLQLPELTSFEAFLNLREAGDIYLSANKANDIQFAPLLQKVNGPMKLYGFKTQSFNHFNQLMEVKGECDESIYTEEIGPFSDATMLGPISISDPGILVTKVFGQVISCEGDPVRDGFAIISVGNYNHYTTLDKSTGAFDVSITTCDEGDIAIIAVDVRKNKLSIQENFEYAPLIDADTITVCEDNKEFIDIEIVGFPNHYYFYFPRHGEDVDNIIAASDSTQQGSYIYFSFKGDHTGVHESEPCSMNVRLPDAGWFYIDNYMTITVTEFGKIGEYIKGTFTGTCRKEDPGSSGREYPLVGTFSVVREE